MRAVIICTAAAEPFGALTRGAPAALLPLGDRPFLQHVMERLAVQGVRQVDMVLSDAAEQVERLVGDGRRWGITITVHLARDPHHPYRAIPAISGTPAVLLGHADRLPAGDWSRLLEGAEAGPVLLAAPDGQWSGWAILAPSLLEDLPATLDCAGLEELLASRKGARTITCEWMLDVTSPRNLLDSQRQVLDSQVPGITLQARRIAPGVWAGRGAVIDPKATLVGPVFIGELAQVGAGARLGPNAVIGEGAVVGASSSLTRCLIGPNSYVGTALELAGVVVVGDHLLNLELDTVVRVSDRALLAPLAGDGRRPVGWLSRITALGALLLTAPIVACTALVLFLVRGRVWHRRTVALTPTPAHQPGAVFELLTFDDPDSPPRSIWTHLLLRVLPGLRYVAAGYLGIVGTEPRSPDAASETPAAWEELIGRVRPGLITEGLVIHEPMASEADQTLADAWYAAHSSRRYDLRLLVAYAARLLRGQPAPVTVSRT